MTELQQDRWDKKVFEAVNNLTYENHKFVCCKKHGDNQPFTWVTDSIGYSRVCNNCLPENGLYTTNTPQRVGTEGPFVCEVQTCFNDADPNLPCTRCKGLYCIVHMDDRICTECEEAETHALEY